MRLAAVDWHMFVGVLEMLLAALAAWMSWRAAMGVRETHLSLNSRLDAMLQLTRESARAEGRLEGAEDNRQAAAILKVEATVAAEKIVQEAKQEAARLVEDAVKAAERLAAKQQEEKRNP